MTVEHDLDSLIKQMQHGLHNDPTCSYIENYSQVKSDRKIDRSRPRRSPSEESRYNRDQWYAMGNNPSSPSITSKHQQQQQPLTPILKRRDPLSPLSPLSDHSDSSKVRKTLNFSLESDRTPVSGYESDFRSPSPRVRSVSPFQRNEPVSKADYYRHKDASHKKPLPGQNQFMGSSWPHRLDQIDQYDQHNRPRPDWQALPAPSIVTTPQPGQTNFALPDRYSSPAFGTDANDFARSADVQERPSSACSTGYGGSADGDRSFGRQDKLSPARFGGSQQDLRSYDRDEPTEKLSDSCQDIDRKGRFTNLPSNWEKSIAFFEQKKEQLPAQRIKSVEPLNAYVRREPVKMTESTPNLVARLAQEARQSQNEIPPWMQQLKHIVIEQMPLPAPPRFGTLLHGRRNADSSMAPPINGPPCHLCHQPITESRCIRSDEHNFHCWHFVCSFCNKTLPEFDFTMAPDNRPYCLNCFKRYFP